MRLWSHIKSPKWDPLTWFYEMGNVLHALPKSQQARAKADMQSIWMAAPRADAHAAFDRFVSIYAAKYPKATETLKKDRESLLTFYETGRPSSGC